MQEMQETWVWSLGWEDSLEESMAIHSSIFAWRIPWTEEPGRLQSIGLQRVGHDWNDLAHMHDVWETIAVVLQLQNENPAVDIHEAVANVQFSSFPSLSHVQLFATPWMQHSRLLCPSQFPELIRTHVHRVGDAIQPSHPLLSPSPTFNLSQHQDLFQWVSSSYQVAKGLEFQLQHQSF